MIQAIKILAGVNEGSEKELSFELGDNVVCVYFGGKYICSMDYDGNFKQAIEAMIEKW